MTEHNNEIENIEAEILAELDATEETGAVEVPVSETKTASESVSEATNSQKLIALQRMVLEAQARKACAVLNDLMTIDPQAGRTLFEFRSYCNEELANHPTIQVRAVGNMQGTAYSVGLIGVLNGILEGLGIPRLCGFYESENLFKFGVYAPDLEIPETSNAPTVVPDTNTETQEPADVEPIA